MTVIIGTVCKNIGPNIPIFRSFLEILLGVFPDAMTEVQIIQKRVFVHYMR